MSHSKKVPVRGGGGFACEKYQFFLPVKSNCCVFIYLQMFYMRNEEKRKRMVIFPRSIWTLEMVLNCHTFFPIFVTDFVIVRNKKNIYLNMFCILFNPQCL